MSPTELSSASVAIASLRQAGAGRFDPARLHFMEVLAARVNAHQGSVRRILDDKLAQALASFRERFDKAQGDAKDLIDQIEPISPHAIADLHRLFESGDFNGVKRRIVSLKRSEHGASVGELASYIARHSPENVGSGNDVPFGSHSELKTTRNFRNTWSKLSAEKQVARALDQAPKNAGPINSHMLVLRSLALMRDIAPDYLNRFTSYADTLLWLDQADREKPAILKKRLTVNTKKRRDKG